MNYANRKIVVMGLGLHGGGLPVAKWFFTQGAEVIVTDLKKREELLPTIEALDTFCRSYRLKHSNQKFISLEYILGRHREEDFRTCDLVVQNPAVPKESPYLALAREAGVSVENETSLFFMLTPDIPKIGVTGTRGKSTTATLIHAMMQQKYPASQITSVALPDGSKGGFEVLDAAIAGHKSNPATPVVMELSSWQLEGLMPHRISPHVAVMTNVFPDHLNRYSGMDEYSDAKKTIYRYQHPEDIAIFNYDNEVTLACAMESIGGTHYWFSVRGDFEGPGAYVKGKSIWMRDARGTHEICPLTDVRLRGEHNIANILAAVCAAWTYGLSVGDIRAGIAQVKGIPSRLEYLGTAGKRDFYNDTAATSPEGTIAALQTLLPSSKGSITLIAGGSDKGLDFSPLAPLIVKNVRHLILFTGTASPHIVTALGPIRSLSIEMANTMKEAVEKAWQHSCEGDIILLSPAAASFGLFVNEFDRGRQFEKEFSLLKERYP